MNESGVQHTFASAHTWGSRFDGMADSPRIRYAGRGARASQRPSTLEKLWKLKVG